MCDHGELTGENVSSLRRDILFPERSSGSKAARMSDGVPESRPSGASLTNHFRVRNPIPGSTLKES